MITEFGPKPIVGWRNAIKGFLGGSLVVSGFLIPYYGIISFIIGVLVFAEGIVSPVGEEAHIVSALFFLIIGGVVTYVISFTQVYTEYLLLVFLAVILIYLRKLLIRLIRAARK